jgi:hypothetical protein
MRISLSSDTSDNQRDLQHNISKTSLFSSEEMRWESQYCLILRTINAICNIISRRLVRSSLYSDASKFSAGGWSRRIKSQNSRPPSYLQRYEQARPPLEWPLRSGTVPLRGQNIRSGCQHRVLLFTHIPHLFQYHSNLEGSISSAVKYRPLSTTRLLSSTSRLTKCKTWANSLWEVGG